MAVKKKVTKNPAAKRKRGGVSQADRYRKLADDFALKLFHPKVGPVELAEKAHAFAVEYADELEAKIKG